MSYYLARTVSQPFGAVIEAITARLKDQGFGVLSEIDIQATLKAKLGAEMKAYRILGACNPGFAHGALQAENKLGVMLPCNVIGRETDDGQVEVATIDPVAVMERTGNPQLTATATEVRRRLAAALAALPG
jgi:uncharacterized protein (DUF302 family)